MTNQLNRENPSQQKWVVTLRDSDEEWPVEIWCASEELARQAVAPHLDPTTSIVSIVAGERGTPEGEKRT